MVDYLETRGDIDMERIGITGHSRGGKATLLACALDERISLAAPERVGCGWWWGIEGFGAGGGIDRDERQAALVPRAGFVIC